MEAAKSLEAEFWCLLSATWYFLHQGAWVPKLQGPLQGRVIPQEKPDKAILDLLEEERKKSGGAHGMTAADAPFATSASSMPFGKASASAAPKSPAVPAEIAEPSAPVASAAPESSPASSSGFHGVEDSKGVPAAFSHSKATKVTLAPQMLLGGGPKVPSKRKLPAADAGKGAKESPAPKGSAPAPFVPPPAPVLPASLPGSDGAASKAAMPPEHFVPNKTGWMARVILLAALQETGQHEWMQRLLKDYSGHKDVAPELKKLLDAIQKHGLHQGIHTAKYHKLL
eukprot:s2140_g18.t1